ncbi:exonuclease SbcCD subunit D [Microbacterium sp. LRZ72]|uniref:exonuclease SbcCD subunit D n=1 Tax=Microbacterium sp. LRZ72 TaxID=2942481 RepID=UPI0029A82DDE|nr:exonuclease SbcCD subunit D [Microbacterium sp. LRZ72]MDX2376059.1 exonuclease SbcCD subunit D [Microbacterium sp. LRZ72]
MRILHTSDWHIGRTFHGSPTLDALRQVLAALVAQVREHGVDVVIVAGDVFDQATPAAECYTLLTGALHDIREAGARVVVTSGNHDSAARLGFQSTFLAQAGVHVATDPTALDVPITIDDEHGPVHFYGIPYLEPTIVRRLWPDTPLRSQADTMAHAMRLVGADRAVRGGRSVAIAHCFAADVEPTPGVEREIRQGTLDVVPLAAFDGPDYVALGHIHGRNTLSDRVRYAGAPLHYSFGEQSKPRGSWLVDLDAEGLAFVRWLDLPVPRRLVTISGSLDELLEGDQFADAVDAWVCAQYTDATPQPDPMRRLRARFPHCATVEHRPPHRDADERSGYAARVGGEERSDTDLVDAFLTHVRAGEGPTPAEAELVASIVREREGAETLA